MTRRPLSSNAAGRSCDALVIGAGPAGALAALLLARTGLHVLLVDRRAFPRYKVCGACVNDRALGMLRSAGLQAVVDSLPGEPVSAVRIRSGRRTLLLPLPGGIAVARDRFDAALAAEAAAAGAEFLSETTASVLPELDGRGLRRVRLSRGHETLCDVAAGVVLAADGLGQSSLQQLPEFTSRVAAGSRIGLGAVIDGSAAPLDAGTIHFAVQRCGYVGLVRTDASALNVAAAVDAGFVRAAGGPAPAVTQILEAAGYPRLPALAQADWHGTPPLTRRSSSVFGERLLLLGDAAGYVEPFTGEGIAWALTAATAVVPFASLAVDDWNSSIGAAWAALSGRLIGRRQRWCRLLAALIRRPWAVAPTMSLLSRFPALARPLVASISGRSRFIKAVRP